MATLTELYNLWNESALLNRITQACQIAAYEVLAEADSTPNHANREKWAVAVMGNPAHWGTIMMRVLIAQYNSVPASQITGATDTAVLGAVRDSVNVFANNI
jgi:hypothetical protein